MMIFFEILLLTLASNLNNYDKLNVHDRLVIVDPLDEFGTISSLIDYCFCNQMGIKKSVFNGLFFKHI